MNILPRISQISLLGLFSAPNRIFQYWTFLPCLKLYTFFICCSRLEYCRYCRYLKCLHSLTLWKGLYCSLFFLPANSVHWYKEFVCGDGVLPKWSLMAIIMCSCPIDRLEKKRKGFPISSHRYAVQPVTKPFLKNQPILDMLKIRIELENWGKTSIFFSFLSHSGTNCNLQW